MSETNPPNPVYLNVSEVEIPPLANGGAPPDTFYIVWGRVRTRKVGTPQKLVGGVWVSVLLERFLILLLPGASWHV
jgi:hypothetical protein